jgi:nitroimidazol reductase NimA-like FMN-containing flavoprotein (pyridoxamine 5'-phosphate oxidase superfamily)
MPDDASFVPTARSKARRLADRAAYDEAAVYAILDCALLAHVAYVIDGQPFVTPTAFWREGRTLYWHGSAASRAIRSVHGARVCVTVSHLDGLVLDRSGFHHSVNYRSVMAFGVARVIRDRAELQTVLDRFVDRLYPGRAAEVRPGTVAELKQTMVVAMEIEEASAKTRAKGPAEPMDIDEGWNAWRGVLPVETRLRAPEPDPINGDHATVTPDLALYAEGERLDDVLKRALKG